MGFTDELLDTYKRVLTQPSEFFKSENRRDGFGFSLKFAATNLMISAVLGALSVAAFGTASAALGEFANAAGMLVIAGITLVATPIIGIIGLLIGSGMIHIFVSLLGGENGYSETLSAMEYATAVQPITAIFAFIPLLGSLANLILGAYAIFLQVKGIENFQNLSTGRAIAAVLLPILLITAIVVIATVVIVAGTYAGITAA